MVTCLLSITLGVTALVAIRSVTIFSEQAVATQMEALGANVLLLPKTASLQDYYAADAHGATLPEEDAVQLALANLEGVREDFAEAERAGREWTGGGSRSRASCRRASSKPRRRGRAGWCSAISTRVARDAHVSMTGIGRRPRTSPRVATCARFARRTLTWAPTLPRRRGLLEGQQITLLGQPFIVAGVIPATGTIDDGRVFAHLHTVQALANKGETVNVIEIMACCEDAAGGLIAELGEMFPDAKVVTITQVVDTQVAVNRLMTQSVVPVLWNSASWWAWPALRGRCSRT